MLHITYMYSKEKIENMFPNSSYPKPRGSRGVTGHSHIEMHLSGSRRNYREEYMKTLPAPKVNK